MTKLGKAGRTTNRELSSKELSTVTALGTFYDTCYGTNIRMRPSRSNSHWIGFTLDRKSANILFPLDRKKAGMKTPTGRITSYDIINALRHVELPG